MVLLIFFLRKEHDFFPLSSLLLSKQQNFFPLRKPFGYLWPDFIRCSDRVIPILVHESKSTFHTGPLGIELKVCMKIRLYPILNQAIGSGNSALPMVRS